MLFFFIQFEISSACYYINSKIAMSIAKIIVATVCISLVAAGLYPNTDVIELGPTYATDINEGLWFIKYYISGCGGCHSMKEVWKKTATALKGTVRVAGIDLQEHKADVARLTGFPTIRFMVNGKIQDQYKGDRTVEAFSKFALDNLKKYEE